MTHTQYNPKSLTPRAVRQAKQRHTRKVRLSQPGRHIAPSIRQSSHTHTCTRSLKHRADHAKAARQRRCAHAALQVEVVDLGAQPARQVLVLDLLQPGAVDVPDASLRDVS